MFVYILSQLVIELFVIDLHKKVILSYLSAISNHSEESV